MTGLPLRLVSCFLTINILFWSGYLSAAVCGLPTGYFLPDSNVIPVQYQSGLAKIKRNSLKIFSIVGRERSQGSGILLKPGDKIITAFHVVKNAIENNGLVYIEYQEKIVFLKLPRLDEIDNNMVKIALELEIPQQGSGVDHYSGELDLFMPVINSGYTEKGDDFLFSFGFITQQLDPYQKIYLSTAGSFQGMDGGGVFALNCKSGEVQLIGSGLSSSNDIKNRFGTLSGNYSIYYDLMYQHNQFIAHTLNLFCNDDLESCSIDGVHFEVRDYLNNHTIRYAKLAALIELLFFDGHQREILNETQSVLEKGMDIFYLNGTKNKRLESLFNGHNDFYKRIYTSMATIPPVMNLVSFYPDIELSSLDHNESKNLLRTAIMALHQSLAEQRAIFIKYKNLSHLMKSPHSWEQALKQLFNDKNQMRIDEFYNKYWLRVPGVFIY